MAKSDAAIKRGFFGELMRADLYKRSQGRVTRQVTFAAFAIVFALAAMRLYSTLSAAYEKGSSAPYVFAGLVLFGGIWFSYRLVNMPRFADFLIAVEAEMNKVSWPSRAELYRASLVVIFVMFFLAALLFGFDLFWRWLFQAIGVVKTGT